MPYNSTKDLPAGIKKLPAKRRRQWMHVWNSVYSRTHDESRAFASANSVVSRKKELDMAKALSMTGGTKSSQVTLYSGSDDPDLPDHVKPLPQAVRSRWVNNYNWCVMDCQNDDMAQMMADEQTSMSVDEISEMTPMGSTKEHAAPNEPNDADTADDTDEPDDDSDDPEVEAADGELEQGGKAVLTAKKRGSLRKSQFAYVDENGQGHLPIHDAAHVRNAMARFNQTDMPDSAKAAAKRKIMAAAKRMGVKVSDFGAKEVGVLGKLKAWLTGDTWTREKPVSNLMTFALKEGSDGRMRCVLVYSNNFKDKEGETFSEASHEEFVDALESGEADYPELHLWHGGPGTRWGVTETISYVNGFAVAGGVVDPGKEHVAIKLKEMADRGELAVSHGYLGLRAPDDVYALYRSFELSPLPLPHEANSWTGIDFASGTKEKGMPFTDKKKAWFKEHFNMDDAAIAAAEKSFEAMANGLKSVGVEYKEQSAATPPPPTPPTPPQPTPPTPPPPTPSQDSEASLMPQIMGMTEALGDLAEVVKGLKERMDGDTRTTEQKAEEAILARINGAGGGGFSPANSGRTLVPGMKQEATDDWLDEAIGAVWTGGAQDAPVIVGAANNGEGR